MAVTAEVIFQVFWIYKLYSDSNKKLREELNNKFESALISINLDLINDAIKNDPKINNLYKLLDIKKEDHIQVTEDNRHLYQSKPEDTLNLKGYNILIKLDTLSFSKRVLDTLNLLTYNKEFIKNNVFL